MSRLAPWAGWTGGFGGWALSDQVGTTFVQLDCQSAAPLPMLAIAAAGALLAAFGAAMSWRTYCRSNGTRRFIAATATLAAGIFFLAILFQGASSLIIPRCHG